MGYDLQAVIADREALRSMVRHLPAARLASIGQGPALMPMTDVLFDSVADGSGRDALGFWRLPGDFENTLADWSVGGPVAYVEVEYFGGAGEQRAAVWDGGTVVLGPLHVPAGQLRVGALRGRAGTAASRLMVWGRSRGAHASAGGR
ncbi:hypothetical protein [Streptomyces sp. NPDC001494]